MTDHDSERKATVFTSRDDSVVQIGTLVLTGVAFGEMAQSLGHSLDAHGLSTGTVCLFVVFFSVGLRFAIGNYEGLHKGVADPCQPWWAAHFSVAALSGVLLILLAGRSNVDLLASSRFGFFRLLLVLYGLDLAWLAVYLPRRLLLSGGRLNAPVHWWASFDLVLIACIALAARLFHGYGQRGTLISAAAAHLGVFFLDLKVMFGPLPKGSLPAVTLHRIPRPWRVPKDSLPAA